VWHLDWAVVPFRERPDLSRSAFVDEEPPEPVPHGPHYKQGIARRLIFARHSKGIATLNKKSALLGLACGFAVAADVYLLGAVSATVTVASALGFTAALGKSADGVNRLGHYHEHSPAVNDYTSGLRTLHKRSANTELMIRALQEVMAVRGLTPPARSTTVRWIESNAFDSVGDVDIHVALLHKIRTRYAGAMTAPTLLGTIRQFAAFEMGEEVDVDLIQATCVVAYQELDYINFSDRAFTSMSATRVPRTDFY